MQTATYNTIVWLMFSWSDMICHIKYNRVKNLKEVKRIGSHTIEHQKAFYQNKMWVRAQPRKYPKATFNVLSLHASFTNTLRRWEIMRFEALSHQETEAHNFRWCPFQNEKWIGRIERKWLH